MGQVVEKGTRCRDVQTPEKGACEKMKYQGPLFAKFGRKFVPLIQTSEDFDRLERENTNLRDALCDMVAVAESQGWDNAEIHNAREALAGLAPKN
jgi:hypothetical protein